MQRILKQFALVIVFLITALGIVFIGLDIFDVEEDFRISWPIPILNTAFISAVAVSVAYFASRNFTITGSPQMLWLGCGALAFGAGSLLRGWLVGKGLNVPITVHDSAALIASVLHLTGAGLSMAKPRIRWLEFNPKPKIVLFFYFGTLGSIALVTLLAFRGVMPPFYVPGEGPIIRDIVRGVAAVFFLASSSIYLQGYSRSRTVALYWYSLGLMLFAGGIIFTSLGGVESRIAWLGRVSQYAGGIYFLVAAFCSMPTTARKGK